MTTTLTATEIIVAIIGDNSSINSSLAGSNFSWDQGQGLNSSTQDLFQYIEVVTSPLVCLVGTVLNLLTVGAFLSKPLRRISCCLYLATRSLAVFGFLVCMFIAWSNTFTPLIQKEGVCELTVFLSYFCPFVSIWMVVIISIENFIRISQPSKVSKLCTPRVAKVVIVSFIVLGLVVYSFLMWTNRVVQGECTVVEEFVQLFVIFNYVDAVLTLLCPFLLMLIVVPLVGLSAIHAYERKKRLSAGSEIGNRRRQTSAESKSSPETRVTHLLLAVSVAFLILHTPFHAIRVKMFILTLTNGSMTLIDHQLHHIFRLIYNLDTCVSCAVYLVFGDNFRRVFLNLYFSRCRSAPSAQTTSTTRTTTALHANNVRQGVSDASNCRQDDDNCDEDDEKTKSLLTGEQV